MRERDQVSAPDELAAVRRRSATRARLIARAQQDAEQRGLIAVSRAAKPVVKRRGPSPLAFVAGLAAAAAVVFAIVVSRESDSLRMQSARAERQQQVIDSLAVVVDQKTSMIAALSGPSVQVMSLTAGGARNARALMFWDTARNHWTFVAHSLAPLAPGRTYQLWFVINDKKISGGTFKVSAAGDGILETTYALKASELKAIAVTEEQDGGSAQPTSAPVIAVSAK